MWAAYWACHGILGLCDVRIVSINRPLTDGERHHLQLLTIRVVAKHTDSTPDAEEHWMLSRVRVRSAPTVTLRAQTPRLTGSTSST